MSTQHAQHATDSVSESSISKAAPVSKVDKGGNAKHEEPSPTANYPYAEVAPKWVSIRETLADGFSEFMGTMVLILFGDGVVAQVVLSGETKGNYQSISWGWG